MLEVPPDASEEFSLLDETALLFRMLLAGGPEACQATNLLRALRQNKGAAALGLLETHEQRSGENTDIEASPTTEPQGRDTWSVLHLHCQRKRKRIPLLLFADNGWWGLIFNHFQS